jgi:hypothetical protein
MSEEMAPKHQAAEDLTWSSLGPGSVVQVAHIHSLSGREEATVVFKQSMPSLEAWGDGFWRREVDAFVRRSPA